MFKVGDIVKYSQKFCGAGEEKYIHKILEINEETGNILIATLNTALTLGCTEVVKAEMIELIENETKEDETMSKYEISTIRSMDNEVRFVIYNKEERAFFAGYDCMGSVNWEYSQIPSEACELTAEDDPEQIVADLEAADEPAEPEPVDPMIEKFQHILDSAVADRDYHGNKWSEMANDGKHTDTECHRMYIRYQQAQGFLEGITNAIFVAGYSIRSHVDSTKLTVFRTDCLTSMVN